MLLLLLCVFHMANAAPQFFYRQNPRYESYDKYFKDDVFDTAKFWSELEDEMQKFNNEMMKFDEFMREFSNSFATSISSEKLAGNEYIVTIVLPGFDEKDILVKAREGILMIQAVRKAEDGNQKNYLDLRTLPTYVNVSGNWVYEKDVLKVVFPINAESLPSTEQPAITTGEDLENKQSREEMETHQVNSESDSNMEIDESKEVKNNDLISNTIPGSNKMEATTYAVDLKNEVEFVPIRY